MIDDTPLPLSYAYIVQILFISRIFTCLHVYMLLIYVHTRRTVTELENNSKGLCLMIDTDTFYVVLGHETKGLFLH